MDKAEAENDWEEDPVPWWQRWQVTVGLAGLCTGLAIWLWVLGGLYAERKEEIAKLEQRLVEGPLQPPTDVRTIRATPGRGGPANAAVLAIRRPEPPELLELRIDVSFAQQRAFRLTIERKGQARAGTIHNLMRDSNGELRLSINTSALREGDYTVAVEGVTFRGTRVPVGWMTVRVN